MSPLGIGATWSPIFTNDGWWKSTQPSGAIRD